MAILKGIQFSIDCGLNSRQIESNDGLIVKWINLGLNRDSEVGKILSDIDDLGSAWGNVCFCHIPLQANGVAVGLAKLALRLAEDKFWMEESPRCIRSLVDSDKPG